MNADDYYRIRALARAGGYHYNAKRSVFVLPDVDLPRMRSVLSDAIDWHRLFADFVNRIFSKLGSFANDWHFGYQYTIHYIVVTQPDLLDDDIDTCDFARIHDIVQRLLKLKASAPIFRMCSWKMFHERYMIRMIEEFSDPLERGTYPRMSDAEFAPIVRENKRHHCFHGKFPSLRFLIDSITCEPDWFVLDDLIALHRGGKYTFPGRRVDLSWLQYAD